MIGNRKERINRIGIDKRVKVKDLKFKRIVDLTRLLDPSSPGWGKDLQWGAENIEERLSVKGWIHPLDSTLQEDIIIWAHCGTHVECHYHLHKHGEDLASISLDRLCGEAIVLDLSFLGPGSAFRRYDFSGGNDMRASDMARFEDKVRNGDIVLFFSDFQGFESPMITLEVAEWLVKKGVKAVGLETGSVQLSVPAHNLLLEKGILEIGKLDRKGIKSISEQRVFLVISPLRIKGIGASPARVLAFTDWEP